MNLFVWRANVAAVCRRFPGVSMSFTGLTLGKWGLGVVRYSIEQG